MTRGRSQGPVPPARPQHEASTAARAIPSSTMPTPRSWSTAPIRSSKARSPAPRIPMASSSPMPRSTPPSRRRRRRHVLSLPRPGQTEPVRKTVFVRQFAPWNATISYGLYVDDIDADVRALTLRARRDRRRPDAADGDAVLADRPRRARRARPPEDPHAGHRRRRHRQAGRGDRSRRRDRPHGGNARSVAADRDDGAHAGSRTGRDQDPRRAGEARRADLARRSLRCLGRPARRPDGLGLRRAGNHRQVDVVDRRGHQPPRRRGRLGCHRSQPARPDGRGRRRRALLLHHRNQPSGRAIRR